MRKYYKKYRYFCIYFIILFDCHCTSIEYIFHKSFNCEAKLKLNGIPFKNEKNESVSSNVKQSVMKKQYESFYILHETIGNAFINTYTKSLFEFLMHIYEENPPHRRLYCPKLLRFKYQKLIEELQNKKMIFMNGLFKYQWMAFGNKSFNEKFLIIQKELCFIIDTIIFDKIFPVNILLISTYYS